MPNRAEQRAARRIQTELQLPYAMALRLLREGTIIVNDGQIIDRRSPRDATG